MTEVVSLMDIDEDENQNHSLKPNKGKNVVVASTLPDSKATPWVKKYRPHSLADVAAHREIVDAIDRLTSENRLPHLLLYGPPGKGKTSITFVMARKLYGAQYHNMILELNASDDRGIDVVRQQIQDFASTQSFSFGAKSYVKLVLLDEADAMTKDAQFAMRRGISDIKTRKGLASVDIVREVTIFVFKIKMPSDVRVQLINDMADIEYRLSFGCNDKLQLGSLIASFTQARSALVAAAK